MEISFSLYSLFCLKFVGSSLKFLDIGACFELKKLNFSVFLKEIACLRNAIKLEIRNKLSLSVLFSHF